MAEHELQALDKISTEVGAAQIKVVLGTQCIKAQAFLTGKLQKQLDRNIEICNNITNSNLKLQSEITHAENEIKSFNTAKEMIRMANVELNKEWLVAKEKKIALIEKVQSGEKKYEALWLECKSRYESLPYVQKLLKATQTAQSLKDKIISLDKEAESLNKYIKTKIQASRNADRKRVIELAEFLKHERPKMIENVKEKSKAITDLMNNLRSLNINLNVEAKVALKKEAKEVIKVVQETVDENKNIDEIAMIMPKLQSDSLDIDDLISVKLDQVKTQKRVYTLPLERKESFSKSYFDIGTSVFNRNRNRDESISLYFSKPKLNNEKDTPEYYSKNKLINILEDIEIDANDVKDLISKVVPGTLQPVDFISAETNEDPVPFTSKVMEPIQEEIEEIALPSSNVDDQFIAVPPTQFLDETFITEKPHELKKTVSFDLSVTPQNDSINENVNSTEAASENAINERAPKRPLDVSAVSDDVFAKIKDMVFRKHKLDSTPPFVYAKNTTPHMKIDEQNIVTSKFFRSNEWNAMDGIKKPENNCEIQTDSDPAKDNSSKIIEIDTEDDAMMVSKNKKPKIADEFHNSGKPFSGYLFSHGPHGLPDSLDVSISTTGYEDGDDFPHCIDSSLLLSPKADLPMCTENAEVQSQEAPNFLSGLRKTGLSFFGRLPAPDTKPDSSASNQESSSFSFNFGGEEKKNRGGLFSMFQ